MSTKQNDEWIAANYENFQEALLGEKFSLAVAIMEDAKAAGFIEAYHAMQLELNDSRERNTYE